MGGVNNIFFLTIDTCGLKRERCCPDGYQLAKHLLSLDSDLSQGSFVNFEGGGGVKQHVEGEGDRLFIMQGGTCSCRLFQFFVLQSYGNIAVISCRCVGEGYRTTEWCKFLGVLGRWESSHIFLFWFPLLSFH